MLRALIFLALLALAQAYPAATPERWDGSISYGSLKIPFSMQIDFGDAGVVSAVFTTGEEPVRSSSGTLSGDNVRIVFDSLGTVLEGVLNGGSMKGTYAKRAVELNKFCTCGFVGEAGPDISGVWLIDGGGRLTVERKGDDTFATIAFDGVARRYGVLSGRFDGLSFTLSHFTGTLAAVMDVEPRKDGKLALNFQVPGEAARKMVAARN